MRNDEEIRKDIQQIKLLIERLRSMREREIVMTRMGRMPNHGEIREMNDLSASIEASIKRNATIINFSTRKIFEALKNSYEMNMKSWENRKKFALQAFERDIKKKVES